MFRIVSNCIKKEMQSGRSKSVVSPIPQRVQSFQEADSRGKHRIQAELKRLEQEARFLEVSKKIFFWVVLLATEMLVFLFGVFDF